MKVISLFSLDSDAHSALHGIEFDDPSLTVQSDAKSADINYIVKQFGLTLELPYGRSVPVYADYSDAPTDFHAAKNFILDSDAAFLRLPANVRSRFDNDPGQFLDFMGDVANHAEAVALGVIVPPTSPLPIDGLAPPAPSGAVSGVSAPVPTSQP